MFILLVCVVLIDLVIGQNPYSFSSNRLNGYNHFVKTPKNSESIQTGGRLIERHLGYLYEAGFNSVLSIAEFTTNDTTYNGVSGNFPSSEYEMSIVKSYGMEGKYTASALTPESVKTISDIITRMKKPLYIHCHVGYTANLFLQLHLYLNQEIKDLEIYSKSLLLGYDYQNNSDVVHLINSLTGRNDQTTSQKIELTLANGEQSYKTYYWTHRLGESDNWYNAGQILSTHIDAIVTAGYHTVISFRDNGEATSRLPNETSTTNNYIPNYEFSDASGNYAVKDEQLALEGKGIQFIHLPLVSSASITWTKEEFDLYYPSLQLAEKNGPVLVHCASGYRSSAFTLTYLAYEQKLCSDWVLSHAADVGFIFNSDNPTSSDVQVVNFIKEILNC